MESGEVTRLIAAWRDGDREAFDRLVPLVYDDLRRIAGAQLRGHRRGPAMQTTVLVHEAWLRMAEATRSAWESREHFLAVCARAMRQIVVSDARARAAKKRGGDDVPVTLDEGSGPGASDPRRLLDLDRALDRLAEHDAMLARVVECRWFAGLTEPETAGALGISLRSVQRYWLRARAWLREELGAP